jgi:exosome complex component CSL4
MTLSVLNGTFVCPGDVLVSSAVTSNFDACGGCYLMEGSDIIRASLSGTVLISAVSDTAGVQKNRISVLSPKNEIAAETVIDVGDKVMCRVVRLAMHQANVEIISVGDRQLQQPPKGIIRREDVRLSEIEILVMHECFRPGDIVRGVVISLGDSKQYYLSTAEIDLGVLYAKSQITGNPLLPVSWKVCFHYCFKSVILCRKFDRIKC